MDKRSKKLAAAPAAAPASNVPAVTRKQSIYDKEGMRRMSQVLKDRRRTLSHDSQGLDDEESVSDFTRTELMAFKAAFARPKYANTYRMEPYKKFQDFVVRKKAEEILKKKLQDFRYVGFNAALICTTLSEDILEAVKDHDFDRYKYIVQIFLVEKTGQSIHIASRWVWDVARDNWVSVQYETENFVALALIVACYYE